jgi:hypothetical protein
MTAYVQLPSDREFSHFLAWTERGVVVAEAWQPTFDQLRDEKYEQDTEQMLKVIHRKPVRQLPTQYQTVIDLMTANRATDLSKGSAA